MGQSESMAVGNTGDFIYDYFLYPIDAQAGYNIVNTATYAGLALIALFLIYKYFKKEGWRFDGHFFSSLLPFIVFGSTKRVITDAVAAGALSGGIYSLYSWNIVNVTPGIYITTALLFFGSYIAEKKLNIGGLSMKFGWLLAIVHLILYLPLAKNVGALVPIALLAGIAYLVGQFFFKEKEKVFAVFSQGLDGAATFVAIQFFGYGEQHVLSRLLGETLGYLAFYAIKIALAVIVLKVVEKEAKDEEEKALITYAVMLIGLAPGVRDILRLVAGV